MNDKQYIAPSVELIELENVSMLAASATDIPVVDGSGSEILSNRRRSTWGNLWAEED